MTLTDLQKILIDAVAVIQYEFFSFRSIQTTLTDEKL